MNHAVVLPRRFTTGETFENTEEVRSINVKRFAEHTGVRVQTRSEKRREEGQESVWMFTELEMIDPKCSRLFSMQI